MVLGLPTPDPTAEPVPPRFSVACQDTGRTATEHARYTRRPRPAPPQFGQVPHLCPEPAIWTGLYVPTGLDHAKTVGDVRAVGQRSVRGRVRAAGVEVGECRGLVDEHPAGQVRRQVYPDVQC